ncbi:MAG: hypothetical protein BMS9Abin10_0972 [Gammaproteobacteria bacterium]|nr:MAG: hypothetical protein BMS9Abin10_0972 [Gammaproteobacteria bacterium]
MHKERRLGPRRHVALEVMVNVRRLGLQRCHTRDISLEGAFIETDALVLRKNARIELVLKIPANGKRKHHRVRAKVASVDKDGATVIFDKLDESTYTALVDLLYPAD